MVNLGIALHHIKGGAGGDGLYLICEVLIFTGEIDLRGFSTFTIGGGGGGGSLVISANEILDDSGVIRVEGGHGISSLCGLGGDGAYLIIER